MTNEFSVLFTLEVEKNPKYQSPIIEVYDTEYLELPRQEGPNIRDVLEPYEIVQNINCYEPVEALESGTYDCLLTGTWDYEYSYDCEGNKDAELMIDIKFFATQKTKTEDETPDEWKFLTPGAND
jgi:hypothetical protein